MTVKVQTEVFDATKEVAAMFSKCTNPGAVVTFIGLVRGKEERGQLETLTLEHYPGMTEAELEKMETEARKRWRLQDCLIIHRFGALKPKEQIVLVACISAHRDDAFEAARYLMDQLKTRAPFWKKEIYSDGAKWVEAREDDDKKARDWKV